MKIQNRIALIFTILTAGIILSLSIFIYIFASESTLRSFFHRLEVRSDIVGHAALEENKSQTSVYYDIKEKHLGDLPYEQHRIIRNGNSEELNSLKQALPVPESFYDEIRRTGNARFFQHDTSYVGRTIRQKNENITIISSAVDLYGLEEMQNLKNLMLIGFLIAMVFVFTFGKLFSKQIFLPIRRIIRNVKGINAHNLHQRLIIEESGDEITDLAKTFNDMLDRLEITFEIQNNFVSNASHEFKTPLTIISGEAQLGLSLAGITGAGRDSFQSILKESEKLEHLVNSMLSLAQTGFDGKKEQWEQLRIDELVLSVKETVDRIMPDNSVMINFDNLPDDERKLVVNGNETLLRAAFSNIVLNSCKYSDNKPVSIIITASQGMAVIEIADQGIGIPDREMAQIFVPFFRASNTTKYKGYGIGLPLTNNIIKMHKGSIAVNSTVNVGTRFVVYLPSLY